MSCLIGPVFVYWSNHRALDGCWIFLRAWQQDLDAPWQYAADIFNQSSEMLQSLILPHPITAYVVDKDRSQSCALFLEPNAPSSEELKSPMRVLFAKNLDKYYARPFAEFWRGVSCEYWLPSRQHRSLKIENLFSEHFRPYSDFDSLEVPLLPRPELKREKSAQALGLDEVLEDLKITSFEYTAILPLELKNKCLYFTPTSQGKIHINISFYPGVVLERDLTSEEEELSVVQKICYAHLSERNSNLSRENYLGHAQAYEQIESDEKSILASLEDLIWGLSHEDRHSALSVLAPDWILNDAHRMSLSQKEQQVMLAYLLKRVKGQKPLPLFLSQESKNFYLKHNPYADYLIWEAEQKNCLFYIDILGRYERWELASGFDIQIQLANERRAYSQNSEWWYVLTEKAIKDWLSKNSNHRPFPRNAHVLIDNFIHQYLMPSGVAALFSRQWSQAKQSPCVGLIDTYYQYILLLALRKLGYDGLFERNPLNQFTANQKISDLQQYFRVERLIYQGLSQRGSFIYQTIMGAIYSPRNLREQSLEQLNDIANICKAILERSPADSDIFEASNDILATISNTQGQVNEQGTFTPEELENTISSLMMRVETYRFFKNFEATVKEKCSQEDYERYFLDVVERLFSLIENGRGPSLPSYHQLTQIWHILFQTAHDMLSLYPENTNALAAFVITRQELSNSYCSEYPEYLFKLVRGECSTLPIPGVLEMCSLINNLPEQVESNSVFRDLKRKYRAKTIGSQFFESALQLFFEKPQHFQEIRKALENPTIIEPNERNFYQQVFDYIIFTNDFYHKCARSIFNTDIKEYTAKYFENIAPILANLRKGNILETKYIHFMSTEPYEYHYAFRAISLRILSQYLEKSDSHAKDMIIFTKKLKALIDELLIRKKMSMKAIF